MELVADLHDESVYKVVPYEEFDALFSAYQRKNAEKVRKAVDVLNFLLHASDFRSRMILMRS